MKRKIREPARALMDEQKDRLAYEPLDAVLVRTPLLPIEAYASPEIRTERQGWVEAAIAVGSLSLARAAKTQRATAPRLRYAIRMATRPTPYGLFSGVGLGHWGAVTTLRLADAPPRTRTRPDMGWLIRLVLELESRHDVRTALTLQTNSAALIRGGRILLSERLTHPGDGAEPPRVSIRATRAALLVMNLARKPITYMSLFAAVCAAAPNIGPDRIERLLHELIDQSLLLTDLRPPLTCETPAEWLVDRLADIPAAQDTRARLTEFLRQTSAWDDLPADERVPIYRRLAAGAIELGAKEVEAPVQVDTAFVFSGDRLRREIGEEVARAAAIMLRLSPLPRGFPYLHAYQQTFLARYGEHREVPLLELLDPHWGLGPPDPHAQAGWIEFQERDQTLLEIACSALRDRRPCVALDEPMLERLETRQHEPGPLPRSLDINALVCAAPGRIEAGDFKVVVGPNVGSPCAGRNLGRFAGLLDVHGRTAVQAAAAAAEDRSGALLAEIVYLPHTFRLANVAIRPVTRTHEIALGVSPAVSAAQVIPLDELTVGLDHGRFYLRWPGHADRVIVSSSHMLNFLEAPPLCRFLAHMHADQETQLHVFDWGPASRFPYLPRVEAGKAVLRPAEWRIGGESARLAAKKSESFGRFLSQQRAEWLLPHHVYLGNGDVRLLLDLADPEHTEQVRREVRRLKPGMQVLLQEPLPGPNDAWLPGPGGHYVVELVVSLARKDTVAQQPRRSSTSARSTAHEARMIPPGGDWLYLKLYGSPETEDDLLTGPLAEFAEQAAAAELPGDFFFLRYSDPEPHLRVRFRTPNTADPETMLHEVSAFARSLMDQDLCSRFTIDTYEREIERYGGPSVIPAVESLFVADTALVIGLLGWLKGSELTRESLAAVAALDLLDGLRFPEPVIAEMTNQLRLVRRDAGSAYRSLKPVLEPLLAGPEALAVQLGTAQLQARLNDRQAAAGELGRRLQRLASEGQLTSPLVEIGQSLLHMHCNRLLGRDRAAEHKVLGLMLRMRQARQARGWGAARPDANQTRATATTPSSSDAMAESADTE